MSAEILLVEDNKAHVELIRRALVSDDNKFNLTVVDTLAGARKILKKSPPDLMMTDYLLPDGKGLELLSGDPNKLTFPVAMMTGHGDEKVATAAMKAGAIDYIVKSSDTLADMPHIIERILREWQQISERKQAEALLKQRERQQRVISELSLDVLQGLEFDTLLQKTTDSLAETLHVEYCKVLDLQPDGKALLLRAGSGWKEGLVGHASVGTGLDSQAGYTLKSNHPVIVRDLRTETRFSGPALLYDHGVVSGISVIIQCAEQPWGILGVHTKEHRDFNEDDVSFIQSAANVLALAIGRKQSETTFQTLIKSIVQAAGQDFFTCVTHTLCEWLNAECAIISEITRDDHVRALGMQLDGKSIDQFEYDLPGAPCGYVVKNGYCAYPEKVRELFPDDTDLVDMQAEGYVGVSLRGRDGDAVGVLCVLSRGKLKLPPKIREVFEIIAVKAAAEIMHKQEEDKLRHKEAEYESLYSMLRLMCDNMPDMMWAKDTDKHYIFANKALCDNLLHAKDTDEPVGKADMFFAERERNTHPEDPEWHTFGEICRDSDAVALESGKAEQFDEFGNIRHKFLFLDVHKAPMFDDKGKVVGVVGSARDITERKRMEMALQEEQEQSRQIINTALDAFVSMDENGIITDWNPCAETLFGWPREEALGCLMSKIIIPEEFREAHAKGLKHYLATGEGPVINQQIEISALRRDGHTFPVELSVVSTRSNNTTRFNAFLRDISERTRAKKALEESSEQLRTSLIGTIVAISKAVGARDPYTVGHQQRVSQLSRTIAQEMGLEAEQIDGIRMGASIHDIGKIYLPAEILAKPGKLSDIEYELIKSHSQVGYDILKDVEFPWPVADIAHQHHERLDGSGYPQGLKGDEICLEARIVAVADVVEAMACHRPYRPALGIEPALEEIETHSGTLFSPDVVDACLKIFREKKFSFES